MRRRSLKSLVPLGAILLTAGLLPMGCRQFPETAPASDLARRGREIFRDDTFGNERFWTDTARLHEVIEQGIQPLDALALGIKVDMDRLNLAKFALHNPFGVNGTKELLRENAVVGLHAEFEGNRIARIGITCAFCHSTVDNALLPGIGHRIDGAPNTDLQVGKILAMLPAFTEAQKAVFRSWPKGTYDPRFNIDGRSTPLVLPPASGLAGVKNETYTAEGTISYWNAYVAVTQMHAQGNFSDPRLGIAIVRQPDLVTSKLEPLRVYQHSLARLPAPGATYDHGAATRGKVVFDASCARCHTGGTLTDNNAGTLHAPAETGMDPAYASRTTAKQYRTTPLRGLWQHAPYFHDGSARTLGDVVSHYDQILKLGLGSRQKKDLEQYLLSL